MGLFVESERQIDAPDDPRVSPDDTEPGKGSIVNIAAIAADFVSRGIRCNGICSGTVDARTRRDRQPSWTSAVYLPSTDGRLGSAEEIAALALYLASDASHISSRDERRCDIGQQDSEIRRIAFPRDFLSHLGRHRTSSGHSCSRRVHFPQRHPPHHG